ncbi:hypothetical protein R1flu_023920 [Riccia fluitans]|uniref:Uncharacterized protein n=1 Tax=Riccia fluitans TaxID=41844 RepID=A0ABD1XU88_9MARC
MDDEAKKKHCRAFHYSLRRIVDLLQSMRPIQDHEFQLVVEVRNLILWFHMIGNSYADQLGKDQKVVNALKKEKQMFKDNLVMKEKEFTSLRVEKQMLDEKVLMSEQETNTLRTENQSLRMKLESLQFQKFSRVSTVSPARVAVPEGTSTPARSGQQFSIKSTPAGQGQVFSIDDCVEGLRLEVNLHMRCEEELEQRERELAKLREAYTNLSFDHASSREENYRLKARLRETEDQATKTVKERTELLKTHAQEVSELKEDSSRLEGEAARMFNEVGSLEEQLRMATLKNETFVDTLKADSTLKNDMRRQQQMLKIYLQDLSSRFLSTNGMDDLQAELRSLECRGFDAQTTSYLRTILEMGYKP